MDWESALIKLAEEWAVIWASLPLFLTLAALIGWIVFRATKAFYAQQVTNANGLKELAEKSEGITKEAVKALEKKLAETAPIPDKPVPPPDVVPVVSGTPLLLRAFEELNSTKGLHLPFDPRANKSGELQLFVSIDQQELERMAAARYFVDRGLIGFYHPDTVGTGVTVTASSTAADAYGVVSKLSKSTDGGSSRK